MLIGVFKKGDERMIYNMVYWDAGSKRSFTKRFPVTGITRDKEYDLSKGAPGSKALYLSANPNGEAEIVTIYLTPGCSAKKKSVRIQFLPNWILRVVRRKATSLPSSRYAKL